MMTMTPSLIVLRLNVCTIIELLFVAKIWKQWANVDYYEWWTWQPYQLQPKEKHIMHKKHSPKQEQHKI